MTNTITKITYDGNDYKVGEGYTAGTGISISASNEISNSGVTSVNSSTGAVTVQETLVSGTNIKTVNSTSLLGSGDVSINAVPSGGTDGQVLSKVSGNVAWATPSGGDVLVSDQANNILTSGMKIWAGTEGDYGNIGTYDSNTLYLTVPGGPTPGGWQPGVNTIAYYTLDGDADDASGNGYDGTESNITYTTLASGIDVATFNGSNSKITIADPLINNKSTFTVNVWCNATSTVFGNAINNQSTPSDGLFVDNVNGTLVRAGVGGGGTGQESAVLNTWYNMVLVYNSGTVTVYVNGTQTWTDSNTYVNGTNMTIGTWESYSRYWEGYISKVIFEDKVWTATEISDYYDLTKGDYGIS